MLGSIKYNLRHLLDFSGRDARQTFWYFVLFVYVANMGLSMIVTIPLMATMVSRMVATAQTGDPEMVDQMMPTMMGDFIGPILWLSLVSAIFFIVLLSAAFARRLHDSNLPGWWGLALLVLYLASLARIPSTIEAMKGFLAIQPGENPMVHMQAFQRQIGLSSLLGWVPMILFIILGVRKSTDGPNRYGVAPVRF